MKTSANGRKLIEDFEGKFLEAYDDANDHIVQPGQVVHGTLTIGYGHTDAAGPPHVYIGMKIDDPTADAILGSDLTSVEIEVAHLVKVALNHNQFDALVSFQFNTGWLAHPGCSLLRALNAGNYQLADEDFMLYDQASGKVLAGLERRRLAEKTLFATPVTEAPVTDTQPNPTLITQQALNRLGYGPIDEDGILGDQTKAAVVAFQAASGLPQSGDGDDATLAAIDVALKAKA